MAMIDGIIRRLTKSVERDPWNADLELEPDDDQAAELQIETEVLQPPMQVSGEYRAESTDNTDYYKCILKTAIENGGKYGDHEIPIPWLRMILAGLEMRHVDPEAVWYGMEETSQTVGVGPEIPTYGDLFATERNVPRGPAPR